MAVPLSEPDVLRSPVVRSNGRMFVAPKLTKEVRVVPHSVGNVSLDFKQGAVTLPLVTETIGNEPSSVGHDLHQAQGPYGTNRPGVTIAFGYDKPKNTIGFYSVAVPLFPCQAHDEFGCLLVEMRLLG